MENTMNQYIKDAIKTESIDFASIYKRMMREEVIRILHASMGLSTEAGELLDAMKKHIFYGKKLDMVNLQEELGDIFWYAAQLADAAGFTFEDTMEKNIAKLKARYPDRFTEKDAVNRNLDVERKILEGDWK
jgi:NTP pyrophosphatase (non-canonical NTP hydrolase)